MGVMDWLYEDKRAERLAHDLQRRPRAISTSFRGHNAAKLDRLTQDWPSSPVPTDTMIRQDLRKLRARSRWEAENDDFASRFLALLETNVIGATGIRPAPNIVDDDGQPDVVLNEAIVRAWETWAATKACDMAGRLTFHDIERLFIRTAAEDGEVLVQEVRGREAGAFGYALHFVDAELLDMDREENELPGGGFTRLGIEFDQWTRPRGYWFKEDRGTSSLSYLGSYYGGDGKRWSADEIIHAFVSRRVGQKRGLPWMSTSLLRMRMLAGLYDSASVSARVGASQMGAIEREAIGEDGAYDDEESENGPRVVDTEPGVWFELRPGEKLSSFTPAYPSEMFDPFVQSILRGLASGMNVGYTTLANNSEKSSYSALRSSKSDDIDAWRLLQRWTHCSFHQRVYTGWLEMAALTGQLRPADGRVISAAEARNLAAMVAWEPRGWEAIDQDKESRAHERDVRMGLRSRTEITAARGVKWARVLQQLADEERQMRAAGLDPDEGVTDAEAMREFVLEIIREAQEGDDERGT
jgi:lambda family phage portal protein